MDTLDSRILDELQNDFPLCRDPYSIIASKLGISPDELWSRIQKMLADKVVRRIGASIDSHKFGFCSTLAAVSVPPAAVERAVEIIGQFHEVTHSYLRRDDFNIWFTIIAPDSRRIDEILAQIRCSLSLEDSQVLNLPLKRLFKLDARFNIAPGTL
jgi:DNA-binding Lrp family transcriptional regulator